MIDLESPRLSHRLNDGDVLWWLALPAHQGSSPYWTDIIQGLKATYTSMPAGYGLRGVPRPGGWGVMSLNGSTGYPNIGTSATFRGLPTNATTYTVSAWVYATSWNPSYSNVVFRGDLSGGQLGLLFSPGGTWYGHTLNPLASPSPLSLNRWYHLLYTLGGGTLTMYQDGVQIGSAASGISNVAHFALGNDPGSGRVFGGYFDSVRIKNRAVTAAEARALYIEERAGYPNTLRRTPTTLHFGSPAFFSAVSPSASGTSVAINSPVGIGASFGLALASPSTSVTIASAVGIGFAASITLASPATSFSVNSPVGIGAAVSVTFVSPSTSLTIASQVGVGAALGITLTSPTTTFSVNSPVGIGASLGLTLTSPTTTLAINSPVGIGASLGVSLTSSATSFSVNSAVGIGASMSISLTFINIAFVIASPVSLGFTASFAFSSPGTAHWEFARARFRAYKNPPLGA